MFCFLGADWLPMTSSEFHMWAGAELRGESGAPGDPTVFVDDSRVPLTPNLINHLIYLNLNGSLKHGVLEEPFHGVGNTHYSFVSRHKYRKKMASSLAALHKAQHWAGSRYFPENINWIELLRSTSSALFFKILSLANKNRNWKVVYLWVRFKEPIINDSVILFILRHDVITLSLTARCDFFFLNLN